MAKALVVGDAIMAWLVPDEDVASAPTSTPQLGADTDSQDSEMAAIFVRAATPWQHSALHATCQAVFSALTVAYRLGNEKNMALTAVWNADTSRLVLNLLTTSLPELTSELGLCCAGRGELPDCWTAGLMRSDWEGAFWFRHVWADMFGAVDGRRFDMAKQVLLPPDVIAALLVDDKLLQCPR